MKILEVKSLAIPEVKVIRYGRFPDHRGYFTETWRKSDFDTKPELDFFHGVQFGQSNESYSKVGTVRGLHLQVDPYMGKLLRTITGRMVDLAADVRPESPTFGKIIAYDMPAQPDRDWAEWIWVPVGFAHGNFFPEETIIEYYCTGQYNPQGEVCVSALAEDLDWSLAEPHMSRLFDQVARHSDLFTEKDRGGLSIEAWSKDPRSRLFAYGMNPHRQVSVSK
ncbi:MAG: dTDP-4-dehydrorhamnose 3,5-epimerase family protein [Thermodesulfobacteriota bacterium]